MRKLEIRRAVLASTAFCALAASAGGTAWAQTAAPDESGIRDIVVTAQKREQRLQDVPIAVTALDTTALHTNRVVTVMDLGSLAPNLNVIASGGGAKIPFFGMRGVLSQGNVAGQDKSLGLYLDGVYIGSSEGLSFDLPAVERIEVLRGPQGTLFGRNSTAGAINVITADPKGEFGLRQQFTAGNYKQFRSATTINTPQFGPFSALISYVHNERDGDIRNTGAGTKWVMPTASGLGTLTSPETLGATKSDSIFAAVKFEPSDSIKVVYKFDWLVDNYTPNGMGMVVFTTAPTSTNNNTIIAAYNDAIASGRLAISGLHRPDAVNNWATLPSRIKTWGHNLTITGQITDQLSVKNVFGYRKVFVRSIQNYSGMGGLLTGGQPLLPGDISLLNDHRQWSDELQLNYNSKLLTLTAGGIYYEMKAIERAVPGMFRFTNIATPVKPIITGFNWTNLAVPDDVNDNKAHAWAGFAQAELHVTSQLDLVGGYRVTQDVKQGINTVNGVAQPQFNYNKTRSSYLAGVNFKPTEDILVYAKFSTGFVAGGKVADIEFLPETVEAWEGGIKADLFGRKLRANLALFSAKYKNIQAVTAGNRIGRPTLGTVVVSQGDMSTKGAELEVTIAPTRGLTFNGSLGLVDFSTKNVPTLTCAAPACTEFLLNWRPKTTATVGAQYDSDPLFGDAHLMVRVDGNYRGRMRELSRKPYVVGQEIIEYSPARWVVNGRVALRDIAIAGSMVELAGWVRNLFDADGPEFVNQSSGAVATAYEPARTFGVDLTVEF